MLNGFRRVSNVWTLPMQCSFGDNGDRRQKRGVAGVLPGGENVGLK